VLARKLGLLVHELLEFFSTWQQSCITICLLSVTNLLSLDFFACLSVNLISHELFIQCFLKLHSIMNLLLFECLQDMSTEIKCDCLDSLCDVLHKFGNLMAADHELLLSSLLSKLNSNQATVRK
jgi:hypothetical protein